MEGGVNLTLPAVTFHSRAILIRIVRRYQKVSSLRAVCSSKSGTRLSSLKSAILVGSHTEFHLLKAGFANSEARNAPWKLSSCREFRVKFATKSLERFPESNECNTSGKRALIFPRDRALSRSLFLFFFFFYSIQIFDLIFATNFFPCISNL